MKKCITILLVFFYVQVVFAQEKVVTMDPNKIQINSYVHKKLPPEMLKRIKATTDTFEIIDGVTFEKAVDLYKRDLDPESNLVIWEEMARVYNLFCNSRCKSAKERMDVYRALLLRSMFSNQDTLSKLQPKVISSKEAQFIISQYKLVAKPIQVIQK